jgi:alpha-ketoglutaric semialdehyde dehydrogenase
MGANWSRNLTLRVCHDADAAMQLADKAFATYSHTDGKTKAAFLRSIADEITALGDDSYTSGHGRKRPARSPFATGERGRTTGQLNMYANLLEEGSWVDAVIDTAIPDRNTATKS